MELEAGAKHRLADEYDAAQERGEIAKAGGDKSKLPDENFATVEDVGPTHKDIHEARIIRDAEAADPGIVSGTSERSVCSCERRCVRRAKHLVAEYGAQERGGDLAGVPRLSRSP